MLLPSASLTLAVLSFACFPAPSALALEPIEASTSEGRVEFSARVIWRVEEQSREALLFAKGDRYRIEHQGGVKTDLGYAGVSIVREDKQEVWYVLSRRRAFGKEQRFPTGTFESISPSTDHPVVGRRTPS